MKDRKGDPRIYIITLFFFLCITCGGLLLGLYIFLPETHSESWYPIVGFILVGIPWLFWLCAYIIKCFSPTPTHPNVNTARMPSKFDTPRSPPKAVTSPVAEEKSPRAQSPSASSPGRRVHFGAVVILGDNDDENKVIKQEEDDRGRASADLPRESEIPLAHSS